MKQYEKEKNEKKNGKNSFAKLAFYKKRENFYQLAYAISFCLYTLYLF